MSYIKNNIEDAVDSQKVSVLMHIVKALKDEKISRSDSYTLSFYADVIQATEQDRRKAFKELSTLDALLANINYNCADIDSTITTIHERYANLV